MNTLHSPSQFSFASSIWALVLILITSFLLPQTALAQEAENISKNFAEYAGSYEGRKIEFKNDILTYQQEGMPTAVQLSPTGTDTFELLIPAGAVVQGGHNGPIPSFLFNRDEDGDVVSLSFVLPDKSIMGTVLKTVEKPSAQ